MNIPLNCEYSDLEDSEENISRAVENLKRLGINHLTGVARELRDQLLAEGFTLRLKMRIEGTSHRTARYVWDMIASW